MQRGGDLEPAGSGQVVGGRLVEPIDAPIREERQHDPRRSVGAAAKSRTCIEQQRAIGGLVQVIARLIREGQANGELRRDMDPEVASYLFIGGLEIIITARVLDVLKIEPGAEQEYYQKVARTVVEVFLRGLATEEQT